MERFRPIVVSAIAAIAVVLSSWMLSQAMIGVFRIRHNDHTVKVTGSAKRRIKSDLIIWRARVQARSPELAAAYKTLSADVPKVADFIRAQGIDPKELVIGPVHTTEIHPHTREGGELSETIVAYSLGQTLEVTSHEIDKVTRVSNDATKLIEQGVYVNSEAPRYLYTKLAELKIQMLAEASKDARTRAEQIAQNTGSRITGLQAAKMGVMQINAANESDVSAEGTNDTTTLDKDVMAIVTATFAVDGH
jgi:hypothetical protein